MKTKVWLNLDPQKVDVNYLYKKFEEMGCDFEAEAIPEAVMRKCLTFWRN